MEVRVTKDPAGEINILAPLSMRDAPQTDLRSREIFSFYHYLSGRTQSLSESCRNIWFYMKCSALIPRRVDGEVYTCYFSNAGATLSSLIQRVYSVVRTILVVINWIAQAALRLKQGICCIPLVDKIASVFLPFTLVELASRITKTRSLACMIFTYSPRKSFNSDQEKYTYTVNMLEKFFNKVVQHMHSKESDASDHEKQNYPWQLAQKLHENIPALLAKLHSAESAGIPLAQRMADCEEALTLLNEFAVQNKKLLIFELWNVFQTLFSVFSLLLTCINPPLGLGLLITTSTLSVLLPLISFALSEGLLTQKGWSFSFKELFYFESIRNICTKIVSILKFLREKSRALSPSQKDKVTPLAEDQVKSKAPSERQQDLLKQLSRENSLIEDIVIQAS